MLIKGMINKKLSRLFFLCTLIFLSNHVLAQQNLSAELDLSTTIEGNRESPKVLYIIPWAPPQGPGDIDPFAPHDGNMSRRIYAPIERLEQQRLIRYYDATATKKSNSQ
jgi:hypothetical protein